MSLTFKNRHVSSPPSRLSKFNLSRGESLSNYKLDKKTDYNGIAKWGDLGSTKFYYSDGSKCPIKTDIQNSVKEGYKVTISGSYSNNQCVKYSDIYVEEAITTYNVTLVVSIMNQDKTQVSGSPTVEFEVNGDSFSVSSGWVSKEFSVLETPYKVTTKSANVKLEPEFGSDNYGRFTYISPSYSSVFLGFKLTADVYTDYALTFIGTKHDIGEEFSFYSYNDSGEPKALHAQIAIVK